MDDTKKQNGTGKHNYIELRSDGVVVLNGFAMLKEDIVFAFRTSGITVFNQGESNTGVPHLHVTKNNVGEINDVELFLLLQLREITKDVNFIYNAPVGFYLEEHPK